MKKSIFVEMDGFDPDYCQSGFHVGGKYMSEERNFYLRYSRHVKRGLYQEEIIGPKIYAYPSGRFLEDGEQNPYGLFHGLSREQVPQPLLERPDNAIPEA